MRISVLAALLLSGLVAAADPVPMPVPTPPMAPYVNLPATLKLDAGDIGELQIIWAGAACKYAADPGLLVFREYDQNASNFHLRVYSKTPGTYRVTAVACKGDALSDLVTCTVTVAGTVPGPNPGPGPSPSPDQLLADLKPLYAADTSTTKAATAAKLAAVYEAGTNALANQSIKTSDQFFGALVAATNAAGIGHDDLGTVRVRLAAELKKTFPTTVGTTLTDDVRAAGKVTLTRIAAALNALAGQ